VVALPAGAPGTAHASRSELGEDCLAMRCVTVPSKATKATYSIEAVPPACGGRAATRRKELLVAELVPGALVCLGVAASEA